MKNRDDFLSMDAIRFGWNGLWKNVRFFVILMIIIAILHNIPDLLAALFFNLEEPDEAISAREAFMRSLPSIASLIIYLILELGLLRIALNFRDNNKAELGDLFREYPKLIKYLVASFLFILMLIIPFWLFIFGIAFGIAMLEAGDYGAVVTVFSIILSLIILVAAVYLFLKYQFYGYVIVDRGSGPVEALKESGRLTEGILRNLFIFWLEIGLGIGIALATVSIFIELPLYAILGIISEDLAPLAGDIVSSAIQLFIMVPITRLAMADIYRRLESRSGGWAPPTASG